MRGFQQVNYKELTTYNRFHISDHSRSTCVHSATTGSIFDKSFRWMYVFGKIPMLRGLRGLVPRNHGPHSSNISTESPTSNSKPCETSPCQLWIAKGKGRIREMIKQKWFMACFRILSSEFIRLINFYVKFGCSMYAIKGTIKR